MVMDIPLLPFLHTAGRPPFIEQFYKLSFTSHLYVYVLVMRKYSEKNITSSKVVRIRTQV
jgi:hypothetical protein